MSPNLKFHVEIAQHWSCCQILAVCNSKFLLVPKRIHSGQGPIAGFSEHSDGPTRSLRAEIFLSCTTIICAVKSGNFRWLPLESRIRCLVTHDGQTEGQARNYWIAMLNAENANDGIRADCSWRVLGDVCGGMINGAADRGGWQMKTNWSARGCYPITPPHALRWVHDLW
jgi:hypothetical protein